MAEERSRRQVVRATQLFARTMFAEFRRSGYSNDDVLRFINEMMDLLSSQVGSAGPGAGAPPPVMDPEAGLVDREVIEEILEFELRRNRAERRDRLVIVAIDVVLPGSVSGVARKAVHDLLSGGFAAQLRAGDALGRLGTDRYLVVLPAAKEGAVRAVTGRLRALLTTHGSNLPDELVVQVRSAESDPQTATAVSLVERCLAQAPSRLHPVANGDPVARPRKGGGRREVVLALGGGAARGAGHAGVLDGLATAGIHVAGMGGCSAGGLVAALHARGARPQEIIARFENFTSTSIYREMRRAYATFLRESRKVHRSNRQFIRQSTLALQSDALLYAVGQSLLEAFVEYFVGPDCEMSSLPLPMAVVATDLVEGRPIVLSHGSLHAALAASCAVPGLFPPQQLGDRLFIDGSPTSELPIGAAHMLGLSAPVLAIYLDRPLHRIDSYHSSSEVVARMHTLVHTELVREQLQRAGVLISIPVKEIGWLEFREAASAAALGREAILSSLDRIESKLDAIG